MAVISREEPEDADEERWIRYGSAPLIATLVLPIIIGVILLLKCVFHHCCVRKTTSKDEMYGLEGRMTMLATADSNFSTTLLPHNGNTSITPGTSRPNTNQSGSPLPSDSDGITMLSLVDQHRDRENVRDEALKDPPFGKAVVPPGAHVDDTYKSTTPFYEDGVPKRFSGSGSTQLKLGSASNETSELSGTLKRAAAQHRQLPDLPPTPHGVSRISQPPRRSSSVLSNDGTSELYATVGLVNGTSDQPTASSVPNRARVNNEATPSSDSETYAGSSSHHPYAKLKKNVAEHPYARVRGAASSANNNDEETDTDNYDLPQFLNNSRQGQAPGNVQSPSSSTSSVNRHLPSTSGAQNMEGNGRRNSDDIEGPVPPRRVGREWRRPGPSQPGPENLHFSGDSQDSRGYTSISVREPLSNIRNEVVAVPARNFDSHYATVSDDSEEMYAAIDDPSDPSYMRIGDRQRDNNSRPAWMGGPNVSSPIPERREANSPLPPVPNVPPPDPSPGPSSSAIPPPLSPHSQLHSQPTPQSTTLPVYAQVSKKSKKQQQPKAPLTNTLSNTSTASSQQTLREGGGVPHSESPMLREGGSSAMALHHPSHRSKRAASLMDNSNTMDADSVDTRRWSKADISYSEFEVVRENVFVPINTNANPPIPCGSDTVDAALTKTQELVDEDNYNIIPDKSSRTQRHTSAATPSSSNVQRELDSGNYHEIEPKNLNNTYQEIGCGKELSDHYQEIGRDGSELYQEIDRKDRHSDDDDDEEDEVDQFYERVKKPGFEGKKKHGYEKIKKKGGPGPTSSSVHETSGPPRRFATDTAEDDDDDGPDEMYECVKYPPYERLKEMEDDMESEDGKGSNYYEDIGYSRVKHKNKSSTTSSSQNRPSIEAKDKNNHVEDKLNADSVDTPPPDVHQLYAQIDKTKKRKGKSNSSTTISNIIKVEDIRVNNNEPNLTIASSSSGVNNDEQRVILKGTNSRSPINKNSESHFTDGAELKNRLTNDNSIEYI